MKDLRPVRPLLLPTIFLLLILPALPSAVWAGGPLVPIGAGQFLSWDPSQPVNFVIDNGVMRPGNQFNPTISRDEGAQFVRDTIQRWVDVQSATVTLDDRGFLPEDITAANYATISPPNRSLQGNPVIFDADGSIIEMVAGAGSSGSVVGFASPVIADLNDTFYDYALTVLNGRLADLTPNGLFQRTILHEFGHFLGLDHSQIGLPESAPDFAPSFCGSQFANRDAQPIMFPLAFSGSIQLRQDDVAWISFLYPTADFDQRFGRIDGRVSRRTGGPFPGANVIAVPVTVNEGTITESRSGLVSVVTDFLLSNTGSYQLPGLPGGDYAVYIERLCPDFIQGSSVGPYDFRFTDFPRDYYNGANESGDGALDNRTEKTVLAVRAGETISEINLISNETINQLETLQDDDEEIFVFAEGFTFPFYGRRYQEVVVNSDGGLTFITGDGFTGPRDEMRLLSGPPRIAPLLTDLDPSEAGLVRAETSADSIQFVWDGVPEWSPTGGRPPNTFSVTLNRNGNISFSYATIDILPDMGSGFGVVGLSPGRLTSGTSSDLSSLQAPIRFFDTAVYQSFTTAPDFDLVGSTLQFAPTGVNFFLYFPLLLGDEANFTGFALTNDEDAENLLQIDAFGSDGLQLPFPTNPNLSRLQSHRQLARLGTDLFGVDRRVMRDGWVRIGVSRPQVASFYQLGNGLTGTISQLDGSVAFTEQGQVLYFTRLHDGAGSFPALDGPQDATTLLALANPNEMAISLRLRLFDADGQELAEAVRQLPSLGCLREGLASLFGQASVEGGFVRVEVDGPGAVGFELVQLADTLLGFNASFGNASDTTSYSAQLANGTAGGLAIFTSTKVVNTSGETRQVTLTALDEAGQVLGVFGPVALGSNQSLEGDAGTMFGLGPASGPATAGSLRVEADGPGVIGDVVFGDPSRLRFGAALPLQTRRLQRAIFSQVANAQTGNANFSTFTGLAFHNPDFVLIANITIRVFNSDGVETGSSTLDLGPGQRRSFTLVERIPATGGQAGGYILVESNVPVVAQQLFGNFALTFLSAVPPTVFQ